VGGYWSPRVKKLNFEGCSVRKIKYRLRGEVISEERAFLDIKAVEVYLKRLSQKHKDIITGKPAEYELLEVNGDSVSAAVSA
jgi:hypothetical protein